MDKMNYRKVIGLRLKEFRKERGLTAYKIAQNGGIRIDQVKSIECGEMNYTIDTFLGYIVGCNLYMYFAEKSANREKPHDFEDIARMGIAEDPHE